MQHLSYLSVILLQITLQLSLGNLESADSDIVVVTDSNMMRLCTHLALLITCVFTVSELHMNFGSGFGRDTTTSVDSCRHSHFPHFQTCFAQRESVFDYCLNSCRSFSIELAK